MELINLWFGWAWILMGMLAGAVIGMCFHRSDWLGGFDAWPRRMVRLGHIAFIGTGLLNIAFALTLRLLDWSADGDAMLTAASILFVIGAAAMPTICLASAWREGFRHLFFIPVLGLIGGAVTLLAKGVLS